MTLVSSHDIDDTQDFFTNDLLDETVTSPKTPTLSTKKSNLSIKVRGAPLTDTSK